MAGEGKKSAKFWAPHPSGLHTLRGSTPFWAPHPSGLHTLLGSTFSLDPSGPHPSRAPHFVVPKFNIQKIAEVEIGGTRKKNWPKSNWPKSNWRSRASSRRTGVAPQTRPRLSPEAVEVSLSKVAKLAKNESPIWKPRRRSKRRS